MWRHTIFLVSISCCGNYNNIINQVYYFGLETRSNKTRTPSKDPAVKKMPSPESRFTELLYEKYYNMAAASLHLTVSPPAFLLYLLSLAVQQRLSWPGPSVTVGTDHRGKGWSIETFSTASYPWHYSLYWHPIRYVTNEENKEQLCLSMKTTTKL